MHDVYVQDFKKCFLESLLPIIDFFWYTYYSNNNCIYYLKMPCVNIELQKILNLWKMKNKKTSTFLKRENLVIYFLWIWMVDHIVWNFAVYVLHWPHNGLLLIIKRVRGGKDYFCTPQIKMALFKFSFFVRHLKLRWQSQTQKGPLLWLVWEEAVVDLDWTLCCTNHKTRNTCYWCCCCCYYCCCLH